MERSTHHSINKSAFIKSILEEFPPESKKGEGAGNHRMRLKSDRNGANFPD